MPPCHVSQLFFGLIIIFLQRSQELPSLDDLTGVDNNSKALAAVALVFCVLTLCPSPVETVPLAQNANPFAF